MTPQYSVTGIRGVVLTAAICCLSMFPASALARTIIIDGANGTNCTSPPYECWDQDTWEMDPTGVPNLGHIGRDLVHDGEYIWTDAAMDERTDFTHPDPEVDLLEFRVTSDHNNLYFYATFADLTIPSGPGATQIIIAIDTDLVSGSGNPWLAGFSETSVSIHAAWEYQFITRFGSGNNDVQGFDPGGNPFIVGSSALSVVNDVIEMAVPWWALGMPNPPTTPLRFTVAIARSSDSDNTCDPEFGLPCIWQNMGVSDVMDAVTNYGAPGSTLNTWDEVEDGVIDYHFDVSFWLDGNVRPTILISEVFPDPSGPEPAEEWLEIFNNTSLPLVLNDYKIGDEETIAGGEGMFRFPGGRLDPAEHAVIANGADAFVVLYDMLPNFAIDPGIHPVHAMIHYDLWATGNMNFNNIGDEVLILDACDTVVDAVHYGSGFWPGTFSDGTVPNQTYSMERQCDAIDTNVIFDGASPAPDFVSITVLGTPTPGDIVVVGVDDNVQESDNPTISAYPNPFNVRASLLLTIPKSGQAEVAVYDIQGKKIRELFKGPVESGQRTFFWDGKDSRGRDCASAVYFVRANVDSKTIGRSFVLTK